MHVSNLNSSSVLGCTQIHFRSHLCVTANTVFTSAVFFTHLSTQQIADMFSWWYLKSRRNKIYTNITIFFF